jgi:hypothetical protein
MRTLSLLIGGVFVLVAPLPTFGQNSLEQRREAHQKFLDGLPAFQFDDAEANILSSLTHYDGNCQFHLIYDPMKSGCLTFKFVRAGKEILVLKGDFNAVFRTEKNILFLADYSGLTCGCTVAAYNLDDGKELWRTELEAVGKVSHSLYSNEVQMDLGHVQGVDGEGDGRVFITGRESYGDYVEILDMKTGKQLAHRVFRRGYNVPKR